MDHRPEEDAPLTTGSLAGSAEHLMGPERPRQSSNTRAVTIAGLTTLACFLLASQAFTAYLVFNQRQVVHDLQRSSEKLTKQMTRTSSAPYQMRVPMNSLPLMSELTLNTDALPSKIPSTKLEVPAECSLEKQLMDFLQEPEMPQLNASFPTNLESMKQHMNESQWKSFETWMRFWLIFQRSQQKPATNTPKPAPVIKTKCQREQMPGGGKVGNFKPQCDEQGRYVPKQCWFPTGFCWCVDEEGNAIEGTSVRGQPDCQKGMKRMMLGPGLIEETYRADTGN